MILKQTTFGKDARARLLAGIDELANAVGSTLGARGQTVIIENDGGKPTITKDGVTVASHVFPEGNIERLGALLVREAAQKTAEAAGDGTTTSTILAQAIIHNVIESGIEPTKAIKQLETDLPIVKEYLQGLSKDVTTPEMLTFVANIATNGDLELGNLIADAFAIVGENGAVSFENNWDTTETFTKVVQGASIPSGTRIYHLYTDKSKELAQLDNPLIFLSHSEIISIHQLEPVIAYALKQQRSILFIANMAREVQESIVMNVSKGVIKANIIMPPNVGVVDVENALQDIAALTGATVINQSMGDDFSQVDESCLGEAATAVSNDTDTVLTMNDNAPDISGLIKELSKKLKGEKDKFKKNKLQERLSMLSGAIAVIKVGAPTDVERAEKLDRVEDAVFAVRAAQKGGILPGGGSALLSASKVGLQSDPLSKALRSPIELILRNGGVAMREDLREGWGVDVTCGCKEDMIKKGIVDPTLVTISALTNAVSVAKSILSTNVVINNVTK